MSVLAEGLEDAGQVEAARALGCAFGQGWYWLPAVPEAEADVLAERAYTSLEPAAR
jgi:EAL domain-containing protein (putative c-di-GMP-specific phosphodiesterase class I)